ncbi:MAG: DUF4337 family protein [Myxococcales bacterium]
MSGHGPHADANDPFQRRVAITMALYTVLIAFTGMLTSQARTKALLLSNEVANEWSFFQAKSTKQIIAGATKEIIERLPATPATAEGEAAKGPTLAQAVEKLAKDADRYEKEKEEIKLKAEKLNQQGEHHQHQEHWFEYATVLAELAIVLASVALLLHSKVPFFLSLASAVCSILLAAFTWMH